MFSDPGCLRHRCIKYAHSKARIATRFQKRGKGIDEIILKITTSKMYDVDNMPKRKRKTGFK
jgi:hypothetical protein